MSGVIDKYHKKNTFSIQFYLNLKNILTDIKNNDMMYLQMLKGRYSDEEIF
jgi:hypothetical protein